MSSRHATRSDVATYVGYALKEAQHALRIRLDEALRPIGLTAPQFAALASLAEEPGMSGARLARRCFVTPQTMNGIIANLETAGLIERHADPNHGRILQATLAQRGRAKLDQALRAGAAVEAKMLADIGRPERERLLVLLRRCAANLKED
jgi:DNA-binding MarR family transcriptional regulator